MSDNTPLLRKDLKQPFINDATYDLLRSNVEIVLPAIGVAYAGLALFWGWPLTEQVVGTLGIIGVLIGTIIKVNQKRAQTIQKAEAIAEATHAAALEADKYAGDIILGTGDEALGVATLALEKDVAEFADRSEITLRVKTIVVPE